MKRTINIGLEEDLLQELRSYSDKTGVPGSAVIREALAKWLKEVAPVRLKALTKE